MLAGQGCVLGCRSPVLAVAGGTGIDGIRHVKAGEVILLAGPLSLL